jgi:hypothetical protein
MINKSAIIYFILSIIMVNVLINFDGIFVSKVSGQSSEEKPEDSVIINDPKLKTELIVSGLEFPTSMAFIDKDDFLILEKKNRISKTCDRWKNIGSSTAIRR